MVTLRLVWLYLLALRSLVALKNGSPQQQQLHGDHWTVKLDNFDVNSAKFDDTRPVTWTNSRQETHVYVYHRDPVLRGNDRQTWSDANAICQSNAFSSRPGGCYLLEPSDRFETLKFLALKDSDHYSNDQWVNYYHIGEDIYSGRTNTPVTYPPIKNIFIPYFWLRPNGTLHLGKAQFSHFSSEPSQIQQMNFFCECEDVCQPAVGACASPCCTRGRENCTVINDVTAQCSCPPGTYLSNCLSQTTMVMLLFRHIITFLQV